jgi:hypothetical protein
MGPKARLRFLKLRHSSVSEFQFAIFPGFFVLVLRASSTRTRTRRNRIEYEYHFIEYEYEKSKK